MQGKNPGSRTALLLLPGLMAALALLLWAAARLALGGLAAQAAMVVAFLALLGLGLLVLRRAALRGGALLLSACLILLALAARLFLFDHVTLDYEWFLADWIAALRAGGGFAAIREPIGNYNVSYLYFLALLSYFRLPDLYLIKLLSVCFDLVLAWGGLRLTLALRGEAPTRAAAVFCALLLLPTVVLNGACWGQCDVIYAALLLHAIACALARRPALSVVLLALSFSFKLQAVFLLPLWCLFWWAGQVKFRHLFLFPFTYAASITPALLLGKPLADILSVYLEQAGSDAQHSHINFNSASVYNLFPRGFFDGMEAAAPLGIFLAAALVLALLVVFLPRLDAASPDHLLTAALILAVGVPFFLPYMHDRYFFPADVLAVVWAGVSARRIPTAVAVQLASLGGYAAYLSGRYALPLLLGGVYFTMGLESLLMLAALTGACVALARALRGNRRIR